jgi:3-deoxy-D-manno-octulosonate 8-phosphate phosphatase KdsC-like HAD superfamily phosphatase
MDEVAMIGDDINDLEVFKHIGLRACPKDAVQLIKREADIVLTSVGGNGVVREFIDNVLLQEPIS